MSLFYQNPGIGPGISALGEALGGSLQNLGQNKFQLGLKEIARQRGEESQLNQLSAFKNAAQTLSADQSPEEQFSAFLSSLQESNVPLDFNTALKAMETLQKGQATEQKRNARSPEERTTFNQNQKLLAGISADAKTAQNLLQNVDDIESAIKSKNISGPGFQGAAARTGRWLSGKGPPPEEQTLDTERKNAILALGDLKGIRLTDTKLRFIEDSLFNPNKSVEQNLEALRLYKQALNDRVNYLKKAKKLTQENPNILYDPTFSIMIQESDQNGKETETINASEQLTPESFADLVRQRRGKK